MGTTLRGIGPAYRDKVARQGIRLADIFDDQTLLEKLEDIRSQRTDLAASLPDDPRCDFDKIRTDVQALRPLLGPMMVDVSFELDRLQREGKRILFEGAQGAMLDVDLGTYPYATSSNTTVGGIFTGLGVGPRMVD